MLLAFLENPYGRKTKLLGKRKVLKREDPELLSAIELYFEVNGFYTATIQ